MTVSRILTKLAARQTSITTNHPGVCRNKYQDLLFFTAFSTLHFKNHEEKSEINCRGPWSMLNSQLSKYECEPFQESLT